MWLDYDASMGAKALNRQTGKWSAVVNGGVLSSQFLKRPMPVSEDTQELFDLRIYQALKKQRHPKTALGRLCYRLTQLGRKPVDTWSYTGLFEALDDTPFNKTMLATCLSGTYPLDKRLLVGDVVEAARRMPRVFFVTNNGLFIHHLISMLNVFFAKRQWSLERERLGHEWLAWYIIGWTIAIKDEKDEVQEAFFGGDRTVILSEATEIIARFKAAGIGLDDVLPYLPNGKSIPPMPGDSVLVIIEAIRHGIAADMVEGLSSSQSY